MWSNSAGGSTFAISGVVMLLVSLLFVIGSFLYVELCRGILYDHSKGNIFTVTIGLTVKILFFFVASAAKLLLNCNSTLQLRLKYVKYVEKRNI